MQVPVIIFAFNRPKHLEYLLESLTKNFMASDTEVTIFIDGPRNEEDQTKIHQIRTLIERVKEQRFFKEIFSVYREKNVGLASNIISGVTDIINAYGSAIVIEDDVIVSNDFLQYMNEGLTYYQGNKEIWSLGGFSFVREFPINYSEHVFVTQRSSSYAWATWRDRWEKVDWEVKSYQRFLFDIRLRREFNKWGKDRASMLDDQMNQRINSWAIRFDYAMYQNKCYNILPCISRCKTTGHDGSGTHNKKQENASPFVFELEAEMEKIVFSTPKVNQDIRRLFNIPFNVSKLARCKRYIGNLWRYKRNYGFKTSIKAK